jgi:hypothetical protein
VLSIPSRRKRERDTPDGKAQHPESGAHEWIEQIRTKPSLNRSVGPNTKVLVSRSFREQRLGAPPFLGCGVRLSIVNRR